MPRVRYHSAKARAGLLDLGPEPANGLREALPSEHDPDVIRVRTVLEARMLGAPDAPVDVAKLAKSKLKRWRAR